MIEDAQESFHCFFLQGRRLTRKSVIDGRSEGRDSIIRLHGDGAPSSEHGATLYFVESFKGGEIVIIFSSHLTLYRSR